MKAMLRLLIGLSGLLLAMLSAACGGGADARDAGVTIEPLPSATAPAAIPIGGKAATPPIAPSPTPEPAPVDESPTGAPGDDPSGDETTPPPAPEPTAAPLTSDGSTMPTMGRWIEVDVTNYVVRLMDGVTTIETIEPVGVGIAVDSGEYLSTQTGLFYVHNKIEGLAYDAPYDTYISHWVGFDPAKDNGFHSFLKDETGAVVDPSTGRVSNGCIRTGAAEAIFAFAEIGMPVWVHW